jgi:hypothetical protein
MRLRILTDSENQLVHTRHSCKLTRDRLIEVYRAYPNHISSFKSITSSLVKHQFKRSATPQSSVPLKRCAARKFAITPRTVRPVLPSDHSFVVCSQRLGLQYHLPRSGKRFLSYHEHLRLPVSSSHTTFHVAVTHLAWILRDLDSMMDHLWHFTIAMGQESRGRLRQVEVRRK